MARTTTPEQEKILAELDEVTAALDQVNDLYARRVDIFQRAKAAGVTREVLAERAGISPPAVTQALRGR